MRVREQAVEIQAPPDIVWQVMSDIDRWPEWTPTVRRVERDASSPGGPGAEAKLWIRGAVGSSRWRITSWIPGVGFTWESRIAPGVLSVASHEVAAQRDGSIVLLRVALSGPLSGLAALLLDRTSRRNLRDEAAGLKAASEARVATGSPATP
jgi:hypothetical protein